MAKKMPRRLVALSATAIASIYLAGFMSTRAAAESVAAAAATPTDASAAPNAELPTATSTPANAVATAPTVVVGASATATAGANAGSYADGTYTGTGTSRFGNVYVSVTVAAGSISNVQITKVTTSFPMSRIASLPAQVVQKQTTNVNSVTGATYSSAAFKQAVQQALAQATR